MMLDYSAAPLVKGDIVDLRYCPSLDRPVTSRGVVSAVSDMMFATRLDDDDRLMRTRYRDSLVVLRETVDGADLFSTVIEATTVRSPDGLVLCPLPRLIERVEHRRDPRIALELPLRVVATRGDTNRLSFQTTTMDVSVGGVQFRTAYSLEAGDRLALTLGLADGPVQIGAVVVSTEAPQMGAQRTYRTHCQFTHLEPTVKARISLLVKHYLARTAPGEVVTARRALVMDPAQRTLLRAPTQHGPTTDPGAAA
jgi:PilZ domain